MQKCRMYIYLDVLKGAYRKLQPFDGNQAKTRKHCSLLHLRSWGLLLLGATKETEFLPHPTTCCYLSWHIPTPFLILETLPLMYHKGCLRMVPIDLPRSTDHCPMLLYKRPHLLTLLSGDRYFRNFKVTPLGMLAACYSFRSRRRRWRISRTDGRLWWWRRFAQEERKRKEKKASHCSKGVSWDLAMDRGIG